MARSIPGQLSMWHLMTSEASPSATSSPGSAGGPTPSALLDGLTTGRSGQDHAPASRSRSQEKGPVRTIQGTCGPTSIASSPPSGPLSSWESRLQVRLGMVGSTEFELIWKKQATPGGRSIFRLSRSTPRTSASGSIGSQATWTTPRRSDGNTESYAAAMKELTRASKGGAKKLTLDVHYATWPTPTKADGDGGHTMGTASATGKRENGTKITVSLPGVVKIVSTWPTPTSQDCARGVGTILPQDTGIPLPQRVAQAIGTTTFGSPEQTGNRGALNPAFPCWLMGFPIAWQMCYPSAK